MSAHTPGPWAYRPSNNGHFIAGTGENSGYLAEVRQCRSKQDIRADARLIAAAPTMYEYVASSASNGCAEARKIMEAINAGR